MTKYVTRMPAAIVARPSVKAAAFGGDFESDRVGGQQIDEQAEAERLAAEEMEPAGEVPFHGFEEELRETLEHLKIDAGKPDAKIGVVYDAPNVVVFLCQRAEKDQDDRKRKQDDREPQRGERLRVRA